MIRVTTKESEVIDIFKNQIEVEKTTLDKLVKLEEDAKETAVRLAFMDLRLDTWKHIKFLEGMIELLTTTPCDEWSAKVGRYAGRVKLERELKNLKSDEGEMVKLLEKAMGKVEDPIATLLLEHMKHEEKTHMDDLEQLVKLIQTTPLQSKKGEKGTDIVCDTD
jgi:bacterioferritin (cytochrome b1)